LIVHSRAIHKRNSGAEISNPCESGPASACAPCGDGETAIEAAKRHRSAMAGEIARAAALEAVAEYLTAAPAQFTIPAMLPLGPRALVAGRIVHTNEVLVPLSLSGGALPAAADITVGRDNSTHVWRTAAAAAAGAAARAAILRDSASQVHRNLAMLADVEEEVGRRTSERMRTLLQRSVQQLAEHTRPATGGGTVTFAPDVVAPAEGRAGSGLVAYISEQEEMEEGERAGGKGVGSAGRGDAERDDGMKGGAAAANLAAVLAHLDELAERGEVWDDEGPATAQQPAPSHHVAGDASVSAPAAPTAAVEPPRKRGVRFDPDSDTVHEIPSRRAEKAASATVDHGLSSLAATQFRAMSQAVPLLGETHAASAATTPPASAASGPVARDRVAAPAHAAFTGTIVERRAPSGAPAAAVPPSSGADAPAPRVSRFKASLAAGAGR